MREQAAEDVIRLLDKPGLRQVVQIAEQARAHEDRSAPSSRQPERDAEDE